MRMSMTTELTQRRYLAFCISELTVTEKGVRRMLELVRCVKDALYDEDIFEAFRLTVSRAKKGAVRGAAVAAETRSAVEEFENFLQSVRDGVVVGEEDEEGGEGSHSSAASQRHNGKISLPMKF